MKLRCFSQGSVCQILPLLFILLLTTILSCSEKNTTPKPVYIDELPGLASAFRLSFGTSTLYLQDYFPDSRGVEYVVLCGDTLKPDSLTHSLSVEAASCAPVDVLRVRYRQKDYDIPVFASEKVEYLFRYQASSTQVKSVALAGNINGWNPSATPLKEVDGQFETTLILDPAVYQYQVVEDGEWKLDINNPEKMDNGQGAYNSVLKVGDSSTPPNCWLDRIEGDKIIISTESELGMVAFYEDFQIPLEQDESGNKYVRIPDRWSEMPKEASIRIFSFSGNGRSNDILLPIKEGQIVSIASQVSRQDLQGNVMYFAMVDRFADGNPDNNHPTMDPGIRPKANHMGGDLAGITAAVKSGYFDSLGVNCVWISPITQNPEGAYGLWDKGIKSTFSAYHGYWPVSSTRVDYRFGSEADLKALITALHDDQMNLYLDYVANHVHEEHPVYKNHPEWATELYLPDGSLNTERWDEHRLTTWFDTFLPTLDLSREEVVEPMTDSALFWLQQFDLDGFRHDATKHIPELFWRTLTRKVKEEVSKTPDRKIFQIGETYGNPELIASYVGSGMLDAQFDFNLYDAAVDAFAKDETDFENLIRVLNESLHAYGHHHLMGNITGNQDRARFLSYADGTVKFDEDPKLAGWIRDIQRNGNLGFPKMEMLTAFLMSVPGIPCIYYGDEIGMPGANDPDNRRMMYFTDWTDEEKRCFDSARSWIKLRRDNLALMFGDTKILRSDEQSLVLMRTYLDNAVIVGFNKSSENNDIQINLDERLSDFDWELRIGHDAVREGDKLILTLHPESSGAIVGKK